jgi:hypothetical protein
VMIRFRISSIIEPPLGHSLFFCCKSRSLFSKKFIFFIRFFFLFFFLDWNSNFYHGASIRYGKLQIVIFLFLSMWDVYWAAPLTHKPKGSMAGQKIRARGYFTYTSLSININIFFHQVKWPSKLLRQCQNGNYV